MTNPRISLLRAIIAAALLSLPLLLLAPRADAGTTGSLVGIVTDSKGGPVADALVTATSPSQVETARTDAQGRFTIASLAPDSYFVFVDKVGYEEARAFGVDVSADNIRSISFVLGPPLKVLDGETVYAPSGLVRSGVASDVYTISASQQSKVASLGGGGGLDNAYSAITAVPGAFVPPSQTGWNQPVFLRGGDFTEVGYELDGVPLNRSYDHIPTTNLSSLGQQELQVYTGGAPAEAESNGLSGYINQVVKQGTYPGTATLDLGIGDPALYNKANLEIGGATPDKRFTYYVGTSIINQDFRYRDEQNGADFSSQFGAPFDLQFAALGPITESVRQAAVFRTDRTSRGATPIGRSSLRFPRAQADTFSGSTSWATTRTSRTARTSQISTSAFRVRTAAWTIFNCSTTRQSSTPIPTRRFLIGADLRSGKA